MREPYTADVTKYWGRKPTSVMKVAHQQFGRIRRYRVCDPRYIEHRPVFTVSDHDARHSIPAGNRDLSMAEP